MNFNSINNNKKKAKGNSKLNYFLMYLIFAFGGIPFFHVPKINKVIFILIALFFFLRQGKKFDKGYFLIISYLTLIFLLQKVFFGGGTIINLAYIVIIFTIPYLVLKIIGSDFHKYYINIVYFLAIISLIFYTLSVLSPSFYKFTSKIAPALGTDPTPLPDNYTIGNSKMLHAYKQGFIIYTYERKFTNALRNPGPFWEPGVYATYLIIALLFNIIKTRTIWNKKNIVFIIAIITTFSTAGYIALFSILIFYALFYIKEILIKIFILSIIILLGINIYNTAYFLEEKIAERYLNEMNYDLNAKTEGRFLSTKRAIYVIKKYALFGRGLVKPTAAEFGSSESLAYGIPAMLGRVGLLGFLFIYLLWFKGIKQVCIYHKFDRKFAYCAIIALTGVLFSQGLYFKPIFLMIFYLPICFPIMYKNQIVKSKKCLKE